MRLAFRNLGSTLAALLLATAPAWGQDDDSPAPVVLDEPKPEATTDAHAEGEYGGVAPGKQKAEAPRTAKKAKKARMPKKPTVMWVGFQPLDAGSSRVFLQLSGNAAYDQTVVGNELVVSVPDYRLDRRNDMRPLVTSFFDGSVARVAVAPVKGAHKSKKAKKSSGVEVRIQFKDGVSPRQGDARVEQAQDGFYYLYLDFGPAPAATR